MPNALKETRGAEFPHGLQMKCDGRWITVRPSAFAEKRDPPFLHINVIKPGLSGTGIDLDPQTVRELHHYTGEYLERHG